MITKKNGSKLVFCLDDGSTVQYDLATKTTIGKRGLPVKTLKSQLSDWTINDIIESIEDMNYRLFLRWVRKQNPRELYNFGSLLEVAKEYAFYEQYFAAGIHMFDKDITFKLSDIPRGLLKIIREHDLPFTHMLYKCYTRNPDAFTVLTTESFDSLTVKDGIDLLTYGASSWAADSRSNIMQMVEQWNYNLKALLHYIDEVMTYEAIDWRETLRNIFDYARMMHELSPKFDKYPRYLRTTHDIAIRNYNRLHKLYNEKEFSETYREELETTINEYTFICPKSSQEIKDEAVQQNNCVASYINRVLNGECNIVFMRKKDYEDKSCVTLEIRDNKVVQSKGKCNRELTPKETEILNKYTKFLNKYTVSVE